MIDVSATGLRAGVCAAGQNRKGDQQGLSEAPKRCPDSDLDPGSHAGHIDGTAPSGVSVADSHVGAVIQAAPHGQITVVTSDQGDMRLVAGDTNIAVAAI